MSSEARALSVVITLATGICATASAGWFAINMLGPGCVFNSISAALLFCMSGALMAGDP